MRDILQTTCAVGDNRCCLSASQASRGKPLAAILVFAHAPLCHKLLPQLRVTRLDRVFTALPAQLLDDARVHTRMSQMEHVKQKSGEEQIHDEDG